MSTGSGRIVRRPRADQDIERHAEYLGRQNGVGVAESFIQAAEKAMRRAAQSPWLGGPYDFAPPDVPDLRFVKVRPFRRHLILYRPIDGGIEVVRVVHASQDPNSLFADPD